MPFAVVNPQWPIRLYYRVHKPAAESAPRGFVFCVMGFLGEGWAWEPQVDHFTKLGYTVVTFDNRGCGRSNHPCSRYTTKLLALDALCLMVDVLKWNPPQVHVLGVSMGGMILLEMLHFLAQKTPPPIETMIACPSRFLSASLMVTQSHGWTDLKGLPPTSTVFTMAKHNPVFSSNLRQATETVLHLTFTPRWLNQPSAVVDPRTGKTLTNLGVIIRRGVREARAKIQHGERRFPTLCGYLGQTMAVATHSVKPQRLNDIVRSGTPILVVGADKDKLVRPENHAKLAKYLQPFEFLLVARGSHGVFEERADEVNAALERLFEFAESSQKSFTAVVSKL